MSAALRIGMACGAVALGVAAAALAQTPMKDGLWEITTKMEMEGMPGGRPPQTMQHCVTPKEAQDPAAMSRKMDKGDGRCEMTDHRMKGNTATWKVVCKGEGAMTGAGTATYSGTSYTSTQKMAMARGGQTMNMTVTQAGKYLGPCKK